MNIPYKKLNIKSWSDDDKPREKLLALGRTNLSDAELIAILIGSGNREQNAVDLSKLILESINNELNTLGKLHVEDLQKFKGIGEAKAISIIAALELGRRRKEEEIKERNKINGSRDAYMALYSKLIDLPHEEFWILMLDKGNRIIGKDLIGRGGVSATIADPKIIFQAALRSLASSIILFHNHPSGNLKPSQSDIRLTKRIKQSADLLEITVLDHIIVCDDTYFSFADEGLM